MSKRKRGGGQTRGMVMGIPAGGALVVVHSRGMREYVRDMITNLRPELQKETNVEVVGNADDARFVLTGRRIPVFVDHAAWQLWLPAVQVVVRDLLQGIDALRLETAMT